MAKVLGNLRPEDDYMHPTGPEPNFNESMYFNFYDRERRLGGWCRIGNRANEGTAEKSVCLYLPDSRVLFSFERAKIANNDAFDAGGLRFDVLEPAERLRTAYDGRALSLAEPRDMADPRRAFENNPLVAVAFDLVHEAVGPMYGERKDSGENDKPAEEQFAAAHSEQHMRVTGTVAIEGEPVEIDGFGLRDHSWGPRYWQALHCYEWLTLNFGPDLGAMITRIQRDPEGTDVKLGGVLVRGDSVEKITDATIDVEYETGKPYHKSLSVDFETAGGERLHLDGRVLGFIPLRNRREGRTTYIGEGMTEWTLGDRTGYGLSELLRQA